MPSPSAGGLPDQACGGDDAARHQSFQVWRLEEAKTEPSRECRRLRILAMTGDLEYEKRKQGKEAPAGRDIQMRSGRAIRSIASKIGMSRETLRNWIIQAERDRGHRSRATTSELARLKELGK
ncbi:MAG: hypothetical protein VB142_01535 [Burkholderia sp.]